MEQVGANTRATASTPLAEGELSTRDYRCAGGCWGIPDLMVPNFISARYSMPISMPHATSAVTTPMMKVRTQRVKEIDQKCYKEEGGESEGG